MVDWIHQGESMSGKRLDLALLPVCFKTSLESRLRAAVGIPAYMRRKRRIEDLQDEVRRILDQTYQQALVDNGGDEVAARESMMQRAQSMDLQLLNDLIERHNKYYPIEANLPTDVQTGRLMVGGRPWEPMALITWTDFVNV